MPKPEPLVFTEKLTSLNKNNSALERAKSLNYDLFGRKYINLKIDIKIIKFG